MTTTDVEPGPPRIVHVEKNIEGGAEDEYTIEGGYEVSILSGQDRELLISKTEDARTEEFVAMYAQGTWLRVWVEETDENP